MLGRGRRQHCDRSARSRALHRRLPHWPCAHLHRHSSTECTCGVHAHAARNVHHQTTDNTRHATCSPRHAYVACQHMLGTSYATRESKRNQRQSDCPAQNRRAPDAAGSDSEAARRVPWVCLAVVAAMRAKMCATFGTCRLTGRPAVHTVGAAAAVDRALHQCTHAARQASPISHARGASSAAPRGASAAHPVGDLSFDVLGRNGIVGPARRTACSSRHRARKFPRQ